MTTAPQVVHEEGLAAGELRFQRCGSCAATVFYPRVLCPRCGGTQLAWERSAGRGVVYSTTTVRPRDGADYDVSLIDLDEGFRMMSTVLGDPARVAIGQRVVVEFTQLDGRPSAAFRAEDDQ